MAGGRVEHGDAGRGVETSIRGRILAAAMETFVEHGFANATTLEIATRARVSKRELYTVVGNKEELLAACIAERGRRMQLPEGFAPPTTKRELAAALRGYGKTVLAVVTQPEVIAVFRLAIGEAARSPAVARSLDTLGRRPAVKALEAILAGGREAGLLERGETERQLAHFQGLLWGEGLVWILLGVVKPPSPREVEQRAGEAAEAFLQVFGRKS